VDWKLELVAIPVTDVDRAKAFYVDNVGFNADYDHTVSEEIRFVQLTPPGSACSIALGVGPEEVVQLVEAGDGWLVAEGAVWSSGVVPVEPALSVELRSVLSR
jgi:catechol 2,3-dioxygenase-like lactoylglutathione lyase family enzyme